MYGIIYTFMFYVCVTCVTWHTAANRPEPSQGHAKLCWRGSRGGRWLYAEAGDGRATAASAALRSD